MTMAYSFFTITDVEFKQTFRCYRDYVIAQKPFIYCVHILMTLVTIPIPNRLITNPSFIVTGFFKFYFDHNKKK